MRPADVPVSVGDASKLREAAGWAPRVALNAALRTVYDDACARVAASPLDDALPDGETKVTS
jgi:GDP-D-mannose dehydratase